MILDDLWQFFDEALFAERSTSTLFNHYRDIEPSFDKSDAAAIRRANLKKYLASFVQRPSVLLVGEAPGPRGCRFSGVAFTSEYQLVSDSLRFSGCQSSNRPSPYKEATATIFWGAAMSVERGAYKHAFAWNCVPFHPHEKGKPLSIRAPSNAEIKRYAHVLDGVIQLLQCGRIVSIGNHAERALGALGIATEHVRHPSRGGAAEFKTGLTRALSR
jgi:hypothetical protein